MSLTLLFITPLVTMRSFSEERHSGTIELLMTAPISELEVVLGKYLASLLAIVGMLILTLLYPIWILIVGTPDRGPIICGYIGMLFLSGSFIAVGILCSAFTRNQIVAGVLTLGALIFLWAIDWVSESVKSTLGKEILTNLSLLKHYEDFRKGLIDTKHIVFYLGFIFYFLFLSIRVIRARKWR
jgi:ABC-2 type transport system permease protein